MSAMRDSRSIAMRSPRPCRGLHPRISQRDAHLVRFVSAVEHVGHQEPAEGLEVGSLGERKPFLCETLHFVERCSFVQETAREEQIAFRLLRGDPDDLTHQSIMQTEDLKAKLALQGLEAAASTPDEWRDIMKTEMMQCARVIKEANITAN